MPNNNIDKIAWELMDFTKETTKKNFISAINSGQLKLDPETLPTIMTLIEASISEGFNKGHKNFMNKVSTAIAATSGDPSVVLKKRK